MREKKECGKRVFENWNAQKLDMRVTEKKQEIDEGEIHPPSPPLKKIITYLFGFWKTLWAEHTSAQPTQSHYNPMSLSLDQFISYGLWFLSLHQFISNIYDSCFFIFICRLLTIWRNQKSWLEQYFSHLKLNSTLAKVMSSSYIACIKLIFLHCQWGDCLSSEFQSF